MPRRSVPPTGPREDRGDELVRSDVHATTVSMSEIRNRVVKRHQAALHVLERRGLRRTRGHRADPSDSGMNDIDVQPTPMQRRVLQIVVLAPPPGHRERRGTGRPACTSILAAERWSGDQNP